MCPLSNAHHEPPVSGSITYCHAAMQADILIEVPDELSPGGSGSTPYAFALRSRSCAM